MAIDQTELDRLAFIEKRDGNAAMLKFAEQTLALYVKAAVDRSPFKDSIETFIDELVEHGRDVTIVHISEKET